MECSHFYCRTPGDEVVTAHFATSYSFLRKLNISPRKLEEGSKGSKGKALGTEWWLPILWGLIIGWKTCKSPPSSQRDAWIGGKTTWVGLTNTWLSFYNVFFTFSLIFPVTRWVMCSLRPECVSDTGQRGHITHDAVRSVSGTFCKIV